MAITTKEELLAEIQQQYERSFGYAPDLRDILKYIANNNIAENFLQFRAKATQDIRKGQAVVVTGYNAGEAAEEVALANNTTELASGIASEDITTGNFGLIVTSGILKNVDTSNFNVGNILYVNSDGDLTATEPTTGFSQPIAYVLRSNANTGALQILAAYSKQDADDISATSTRLWATAAANGDGQPGSTPITLDRKEGGFTVSTPSSPSSAASFEINLTGAVAGAWAQIYWNGGADPSFSFTGTSAAINTYPSGAIARANYDNIIILRYDGSNITKTINAPVFYGDVVNQVKTETGTTYTIVLADNGKYIRHNNESAITVTIPVNNSVAFSVGTEITLEQMGAGTITVQGQDDSSGSGETVTFNTTDLVSQGQGKILVLKKVNTNVWNVIGGTSA